jgi:adenosylhomocysteine nucleosidase
VGACALLQLAKAEGTLTRLGVVVALPAEARTLLNEPIQPGGRAALGDGFVQLCGIGTARARDAAGALLEAGATALLSWGTCGGLDTALTAGSLVLPETVVSSAGAIFGVEPAWCERVSRCLARHIAYSHGPLVESRSVLGRPADKSALSRASGAVAVDMESAAVAEVARTAGVPFLVVRAVLDPAKRTIPAGILRATDPYGRVRGLPLLQALLWRPRTLIDLWQLRADLRAAQVTLASVARLAGPALLAE